MIIVLKPQCTKEQLNTFTADLKHDYNVSVNTWVGTSSTVLGLIGDTSAIDLDYISAQPFVESVKRVQEPYKKANQMCIRDRFSSPTIATGVSPTI